MTRFQSLKAATIAALASPLIGLLCRSLDWRVEGEEHYSAVVKSGRQPILACWHGRILPGAYHFRDRGIVVIISRNFDGEWIARIIRRFGYGTARGSSSRGGVRALVQMRRDLADGHPVAFTVDGPRGPARVAHPGAAFLAGATGHPILPFHIEAASAWHARSWDRALVPRPFSRVAVAVGPPFFVAADADDAALERRRQDLEAELHRLEQRATAMLDRP